MTEPYEPVRYAYSRSDGQPTVTFDAIAYKLSENIVAGLGSISLKYRCHVTLANGQRIIVRALSEERKAARADRKRYHCIVSSPLYKEGQATLNRIQARLTDAMMRELAEQN